MYVCIYIYIYIYIYLIYIGVCVRVCVCVCVYTNTLRIRSGYTCRNMYTRHGFISYLSSFHNQPIPVILFRSRNKDVPNRCIIRSITVLPGGQQHTIAAPQPAYAGYPLPYPPPGFALHNCY